MYLAQDKTLLARERFTVKLRKPRTVEIFQRCSLCFAQPPVYGGPQLSHQNKMLTSNSNHSHQIQISHIKFRSLTASSKSLTVNSNCSQQITNCSHQIQIVHIKYKSFTSNINRSHQIQIVHIKYKSLTANTNTVSEKRGLRAVDLGMQTAD